MIHPRLPDDVRCGGFPSWLVLSGMLALLGWLPLAGCAAHPPRHFKIKQKASLAQSRVKYELARQQFQSGRTDTAIETLAEAIRANPQSADQFLLLAQCYIELGQFVSAREAAEKAKACQPESAEADYTLGVIAERSNDLELALMYYHRACSYGKGAVDYIVAEAECLTALGRSSEAIALISDQIDRFDSDGTLEMLLAQIHLLDGHKDLALRELGFALDRSGCDTPHLRGSQGCAQLIEEYGELLTEQKRYPQAISLLQPYVASSDHASLSSITALGMSYIESGQALAALRLLLPQITHHPESATYWQLLAQASILEHDWKTARRCVDALQRLAPDTSQTFLIRGYVCWKQHDLEEAQESVKRALAIEPNDAAAQCLLGQIIEDGGRDLAEAQTHYDRAFQIDPRYVCAGRLPLRRPGKSTEAGMPLTAIKASATRASLP